MPCIRKAAAPASGVVPRSWISHASSAYQQLEQNSGAASRTFTRASNTTHVELHRAHEQQIENRRVDETVV